MLWEWEDGDKAVRTGDEVPVDFNFFSFFAIPKDYYKIPEVDYDALEETIRSIYIHLALKWHHDKKQGEEKATSDFGTLITYQGGSSIEIASAAQYP
ncbi:hypothetical protein ZWY2020_027948 [Hordeum vulgare]|nr:hypothetical protein ZWY2020_027948 [Hordeum vulgare]